jgi:hypothetical protein
MSCCAAHQLWALVIYAVVWLVHERLQLQIHPLADGPIPAGRQRSAG